MLTPKQLETMTRESLWAWYKSMGSCMELYEVCHPDQVPPGYGLCALNELVLRSDVLFFANASSEGLRWRPFSTPGQGLTEWRPSMVPFAVRLAPQRELHEDEGG